MSSPDVTDLYKGVADKRDRVFGKSFYGDFLNWGYWKADTANHVDACENLVELVLAMAPRSGDSVLEAGCGVGGVSRRLSQHYKQVTGINIMPDQLEQCRPLVPTATFHKMDATALEFDKATFDDVISIEAAMHFNTRERFFGESHRVLRPGGHLAFADIIAAPAVSRSNVTSVEDYTRALEAAGFVEVRVVDVTKDISLAHADYCLWYLRDCLERGAIDQQHYDKGVVGVVTRLAATHYYVVGSARKPFETQPAWRANPQTSHCMSSLLTATAVI